MKGMRGQTLVLVALALVVLFGMAALALDGGNVYLQRRQMQTAADAAALAAARTLCMGGSMPQAVATAEVYCLNNGADNDGSGNSCGVAAGTAPKSALATAPKAVDTWLASIVGPGLGVIDVAAGAEANCQSIGAAWSLIPLTVPLDEFEVGETYLVKTEQSSMGSFKWLDWDGGGGGAAELVARILNPTDDVITIGDLIWAATETGQMQNAIDTLWERWKCQEVVVPIYDYTNEAGGSNRLYHISGFAAFKLTGYCRPGNGDGVCPGYTMPSCAGNERKIEGEFVNYVHLDAYAGGPDTGVYVVGLSR